MYSVELVKMRKSWLERHNHKKYMCFSGMSLVVHLHHVKLS